MIGIIANPASGKDIRRLVAQGTVFDNMEKVNIVQRILLTLWTFGVRDIRAMPDIFGIAPRAVEQLRRNFQLEVEVGELPLLPHHDADDSTRAARLLEELGASCIITLGGDGTNRAVAKACGQVPLLPLSTGTNNVFPTMLEGTVAGLAAVVGEQGGEELARCHQAKVLNIYRDGVQSDLALVDAVFSSEAYVASRALWSVSHVREVVVTVARPGCIGFAGLAGCLCPVDAREPAGLYLALGPGPECQPLQAAIAPGIICRARVRRHQRLELGQRLTLSPGQGTLALDGEREIMIGERERVEVELSHQGPRVLDVDATLTAAARAGFFQQDHCADGGVSQVWQAAD